MHRRADHLPPLPHRKEIGARHCCGRPRDKCRLLTQNPGRCHLPPAHNSQLIGQHLAYRNTPFSVRHGVEMACGAESGLVVYGKPHLSRTKLSSRGIWYGKTTFCRTKFSIGTKERSRPRLDAGVKNRTLHFIAERGNKASISY